MWHAFKCPFQCHILHYLWNSFLCTCTSIRKNENLSHDEENGITLFLLSCHISFTKIICASSYNIRKMEIIEHNLFSMHSLNNSNTWVFSVFFFFHPFHYDLPHVYRKMRIFTSSRWVVPNCVSYMLYNTFMFLFSKFDSKNLL